jgi:hypothetical protein
MANSWAGQMTCVDAVLEAWENIKDYSVGPGVDDLR